MLHLDWPLLVMCFLSLLVLALVNDIRKAEQLALSPICSTWGGRRGGWVSLRRSPLQLLLPGGGIAGEGLGGGGLMGGGCLGG